MKKSAEVSHFGGSMPHRYDGASKFCAYCNRHKNWKQANAGYAVGKVLEGAS